MAYPGGHPEEEALESYAMGTLAGDQLQQVEEHLLVCAGCRAYLDWIDAFVRSVREAAGELLESFAFIHATEQGPVRLWVERSSTGGWLARYSGPDLEGMMEVDAPLAACHYLRRAFLEMFPEHRCTAACGLER